MMGRIENIFTDQLYNQFASEISGMLQLWKPKLLPSGTMNKIDFIQLFLFYFL